jgi:hypothetical protein
MWMVRMARRVGVCWRRGHEPWSEELVDPFCDRCGATLGERKMTPLG